MSVDASSALHRSRIADHDRIHGQRLTDDEHHETTRTDPAQLLDGTPELDLRVCRRSCCWSSTGAHRRLRLRARLEVVPARVPAHAAGADRVGSPAGAAAKTNKNQLAALDEQIKAAGARDRAAPRAVRRRAEGPRRVGREALRGRPGLPLRQGRPRRRSATSSRPPSCSTAPTPPRSRREYDALDQARQRPAAPPAGRHARARRRAGATSTPG